jgi:hypothetical protein
LGLSVEVVHRSPKPTPEKVLLFAWAREWHKEGRSVDLSQLLPRRGFLRCWRDAGLCKGPSPGFATTGG